VDEVRHAAGAQELAKERRAAGPVHVVVAEDRHRLAALHRVGEARRRGLHVGQDARIGHEVAQTRREEGGRLLHGHAAPREHPRQHVGHAVRLRDRRGDHRSRGVAALVPGAAEDGSRHAEQGTRF
jgi:hypothetical protein